LEYLRSEGVDVVALFTQPDKPVGRKKTLTPPFIKSYLQEKGIDIPIFQPNQLRGDEISSLVSSLKPDFILVASYGKLIPKSILDIATPINLHASILPSLRGASPIHEMILHGTKVGGVSAMLMSEGLDEGDMLSFSFLEIEEDADIESLSKSINLLAAKLALKTVRSFDTILPIAQFHPLSSYCSKIKKEDSIVSLECADEVYRKYRAYKIWPGIAIECGIKLTEIMGFQKEGSFTKGEIIGIGEGTIMLGCAKGALYISRLQIPGKSAVDALSFINGRRLKVGDTLF